MYPRKAWPDHSCHWLGRSSLTSIPRIHHCLYFYVIQKQLSRTKDVLSRPEYPHIGCIIWRIPHRPCAEDQKKYQNSPKPYMIFVTRWWMIRPSATTLRRQQINTAEIQAGYGSSNLLARSILNNAIQRTCDSQVLFSYPSVGRGLAEVRDSRSIFGRSAP
jgi:hypothetical protein